MAEFTQLRETQPQLSPVNIADESKGHDAIASVFGNVVKAASTELVAIKKEQSDVLLMDRQNQAVEIATNARIKALQNPDQADEIARNAHELSKSLYAGLDGKSNQKLRSTVDVHLGQLDLELARIGATQNRLQVKNAFADGWKTQNQIMMNDFDPESLKQSYQTNLQALETQRALGNIKPYEYDHYKKSLDYTLEYHRVLNDALKKKGIPAEKFATLRAMANHDGGINNAGDPINQTTKNLYDIHTDERGKTSALALVDKGVLPNTNQLMSLPPPAFHEVMQRYAGATEALGMINSNSDERLLHNEYTNLSAASSHSPKDLGKLHFIHDYLNDLKNGNYWEAKRKTNAGMAIDQRNVQELTALKNKVYDGSPEQQAAALAEDMRNEDARYRADRVNLGYAQHTPTQLISGATQQETTIARSGFQRGGNPDDTLEQLYNFPKDQQFWLTRNMNDPKSGKANKNEALYTVGTLRTSTGTKQNQPDQFARDLITANSDGIDYSVLKLGVGKEESGRYDTTIRNNITARLGKVGAFLIHQPEGMQNNGNYYSGTVASGINMVKYQLIKSGDFSGNHSDTHVKDYVNRVISGHDIYRGQNSETDLNETGLTRAQTDIYVKEILNRFKESLLNHPNGYTREAVEKAIENGGLIVRNTRDGHFAVMDANDSVRYLDKYSTNTHFVASENHRKSLEGK